MIVDWTERSGEPMELILVMTTLPDRAGAMLLAEKLVDGRLAACVNVLAGCTSVYRWQGGTETVEEVPVLIKITAACYTQVEQTVKAMHPYELPELIVVEIKQGLPAYLQWITLEVQGATQGMLPIESD